VKRVNENLVTSLQLTKLSDLRSNVAVAIERVVCEMLSWERSFEMAHKKNESQIAAFVRIRLPRLLFGFIVLNKLVALKRLVVLKRLVLLGF
jgi:hypothetical protein